MAYRVELQLAVAGSDKQFPEAVAEGNGGGKRYGGDQPDEFPVAVAAAFDQPEQGGTAEHIIGAPPFAVVQAGKGCKSIAGGNPQSDQGIPFVPWSAEITVSKTVDCPGRQVGKPQQIFGRFQQGQNKHETQQQGTLDGVLHFSQGLGRVHEAPPLLLRHAATASRSWRTRTS